MLQRLDSFLDEELLLSDGLWSHDQLERMNQEFTAAVERALELGLESRAAARATVRVGREAAIESALEAAWNWLCCKKGDVSASEVVKFVRARVPNIEPARVRFGLEQRFRERGVEW